MIDNQFVSCYQSAVLFVYLVPISGSDAMKLSSSVCLMSLSFAQ